MKNNTLPYLFYTNFVILFVGAGFLMEAFSTATVYLSIGLLAVTAAMLVKLLSHEAVAAVPIPTLSQQPCSP